MECSFFLIFNMTTRSSFRSCHTKRASSHPIFQILVSSCVVLVGEDVAWLVGD